MRKNKVQVLVSGLISWVASDGGLVQSRAVLSVAGPGNSGQPVIDAYNCNKSSHREAGFCKSLQRLGWNAASVNTIPHNMIFEIRITMRTERQIIFPRQDTHEALHYVGLQQPINFALSMIPLARWYHGCEWVKVRFHSPANPLNTTSTT